MAFFKENGRIIWFHCASLGEFEQGRPVIEAIKKNFKGYKILLTFFSPSGYEIRKKYEQADFVFYLPMDTPANAHRFVKLTKPSLVFFIKYEFWFNYINELSNNKIPLFYVSSIFRPSQHFFKPWGGWARKRLQKVTHFFVQNEQSIELLHGIGVYHVEVSGDTRFDRVIQLSAEQREIPLVSEFIQNKITLVAGSTWPEDEKILKELLKESKLDFKLVIAPHMVDEEHLKQILDEFKQFNPVLFSSTESTNYSKSRVLVIDTIGQLGYIYKYATLAYVGGGFGAGIHNILEAATYGLPVIIGPIYSKFNEAIELIELGAAFPVQNIEECSEVFNSLTGNREECHEAGKIARDYVLKNAGATAKIIAKTREYL
ncbi:MAG TPA: glycosyltransferase N-terminal domain-containing protein [Bacteroidales bacterium]